MGALQDVTEEFRNATPGGKALMLVALIAVAGVAYYVYKSRQGNSNAGTLVPVDLTGTSGDTSGSSTPSSTNSGNSHRFPEPKNTHKPPPPKGPTHQTFTLTKDWLASHKHGPLHQLAKQFHISYIDLFNANRNILGNDPNHAKYKAGDVLVIPDTTTSTNATPNMSTAQMKMPKTTLPKNLMPQTSHIQQNVKLTPA